MLQIKSSLAHCWLLSPQRTGMEKLHMVLLRTPMQARTFFWNLNNWPFIKQWINSFNFFLYNDQMCMWWQNKGLLHKGPASCAAVNLTGGPGWEVGTPYRMIHGQYRTSSYSQSWFWTACLYCMQYTCTDNSMDTWLKYQFAVLSFAVIELSNQGASLQHSELES